MYILSIACQTNVCSKPMWSNAHQIHPRLEVDDAQQNSFCQGEDMSPFSFPSVYHLRLTATDHASFSTHHHTHPNLRSESTRGQKTLKFRRSRLRVDRYPKMAFACSEARFWPKSGFEDCSAPNEVSVLSFFEPSGQRACTRAMF